MSKTKLPPYYTVLHVDDPLAGKMVNEWWNRIQKRNEQAAIDNRAIGYSMCELDVWDVIESLDLPLCTRIKMVERFNELLNVRKVTSFQITENDLNQLL